MTHLESLTQKLHALLPELMELSFGCKFLDDTGESYIYDGKLPKGLVRSILGHPITLNEIIEVLPEEYGYSKTKGFVKFHKEPRQHYTRMAIYWAKGLPLHKQSPDLWQFLDNLLPEPNAK